MKFTFCCIAARPTTTATLGIRLDIPLITIQNLLLLAPRVMIAVSSAVGLWVLMLFRYLARMDNRAVKSWEHMLHEQHFAINIPFDAIDKVFSIMEIPFRFE